MTPGPRTRLVTGAVFGRYRLERLLGTGGMASVWQARDERLGRSVAVKVLSETLALDDDYVRRFEREAKIAAGLSHPNLVGVFDYGTADERPYLVTEYVEGGTLADRIETGEEVDAVALARELLEALAHIHAAGVVHRDVKPANVLIDLDGRSRLTDFGIAQPHGATRFTRTGQVVGTRGYMAPEVEQGEEATPRSDLYSAGVVIDEALDRTAAPGLAILVDRLTADDPGDRPSSADELLDLLDRDADDATTLPLEQTDLPPTERMPSRRIAPAGGEGRKRAAALLGICAAVALAGLAIAQAIGGGGGTGAGGAATAAKSTDTDKKQKKPAVASTPAPAAAAAATTPTDPCAALEQQAAVPGVDKEAEKALKEQLKACSETQKHALEAAGESPEGHGNGHGNAFGHVKGGEGD